jgi:hypothetical protein
MIHVLLIFHSVVWPRFREILEKQQQDLAGLRLIEMNNLLEKVEGMMTTILEIMDIEAVSDGVAPAMDDELAKETELNSDVQLIELCW